MDIRAAVARAKSAPLSLETLQLDDPRADEILVRVVACGVCHTDIAMRDQVFPVPQPVVLGHEGAGVVEKVGSSVTKVAPGDHVVMSFDTCGACPSCLEHEISYCHQFYGRNFGGVRADGTTALSRNGEVVHGNFFGQSSFATHALCGQRNVVKVPRDLPLEMLGPLACGVQTGAGAVINALRVGPGKSIAVFGTGSVGLSAVLAARVVGAGKIIALDVNESRLALARELGATHVINPRKDDAVAAIKSITGEGARFAVETTALPAVIRQAVDSLSPRGTCGMIGASHPGEELKIDIIDALTSGKRIRGIVEGDATPDVFIPELIELHRQGRFPFDRMVKFYPFEQINEAIHDSETGATVKAILRMPA
jgi:aryl-alcohol dehydrogenase